MKLKIAKRLLTERLLIAHNCLNKVSSKVINTKHDKAWMDFWQTSYKTEITLIQIELEFIDSLNR